MRIKVELFNSEFFKDKDFLKDFNDLGGIFEVVEKRFGFYKVISKNKPYIDGKPDTWIMFTIEDRLQISELPDEPEYKLPEDLLTI